jgi:hypothetical protein
MLRFLRRQRNKKLWTSRKKRLFVAACCRRHWTRLENSMILKAVEAAEQFADGLVTAQELDAAWSAASDAANRYAAPLDMQDDRRPVVIPPEVLHLMHLRAFAFATANVASPEAVCITIPAELLAHVENAEAEMTVQCDLLRCVIGDPFQPRLSIAPSCLKWNDRTVIRLAEAAYEHRSLPAGTLDPGRLGILADALEESGAADEVVLEHLRSPGPHVRGCFAVDAVLGRT